MRPKAEWAIDSEAIRARGKIVLEKSNLLVKKISRLNIFRKLKLDFNPLLPPKHYKYGGAFRYSWAITYKNLVLSNELIKVELPP